MKINIKNLDPQFFVECAQRITQSWGSGACVAISVVGALKRIDPYEVYNYTCYFHGLFRGKSTAPYYMATEGGMSFMSIGGKESKQRRILALLLAAEVLKSEKEKL